MALSNSSVSKPVHCVVCLCYGGMARLSWLLLFGARSTILAFQSLLSYIRLAPEPCCCCWQRRQWWWWWWWRLWLYFCRERSNRVRRVLWPAGSAHGGRRQGREFAGSVQNVRPRRKRQDLSAGTSRRNYYIFNCYFFIILADKPTQKRPWVEGRVYMLCL